MTKRIYNHRTLKNATPSRDAAGLAYLQERFEALKKRVPTLVFGSTEESCTYQHVLDFTDEATPKWEFRLWCRYDENGNPAEVVFLGEHGGLVDRFRPGRTYISTSDEDEFVDALQFVREKPYLAFASSMNFYTYDDREAAAKEYSEAEAKEKYDAFYSIKKAKEAFEAEVIHLLKDVVLPQVLKKVDFLTGISLVDHERNGCTWASPKFDFGFSISVAWLRKHRVDLDGFFDLYCNDLDTLISDIVDKEIYVKFNDSDKQSDISRFIPYVNGGRFYTSYDRLFEDGTYVVRKDKYGNILL